MSRFIPFAFIVLTGLICVGLYRIAESARIAQAELNMTEAQIARENDDMTVLGAEWARVTSPSRIQALAARHLALSDRPSIELSSLSGLPLKGEAPLSTPGAIRDARDVVPTPPPAGVKILTVAMGTGN